jgi:hypothetical protein
MNQIDGLPLDYLIDTDKPGHGRAGRFTVVAFDVTAPLRDGISGAYVNLLVEPEGDPPRVHARFAPFLKRKGTAAQYEEGIPDPAGPGFERNLREQLTRRKLQGFKILGDVDNPDTFTLAIVKRAYDIAHAEGFSIICKNPGLGCSSKDGDSDAEERQDAAPLIAHPAVIGIIAEKDDDATPAHYDAMRKRAGKPNLMVRFVAFGHGRKWAEKTAHDAQAFFNTGVTYCDKGEYKSVIDLLVPIPPAPVAV